MMKAALTSMVVLFTLLVSCSDDEIVPPVDSAYKEYFPLKPGLFIEYAADSIIHLETDDQFNVDTAILAYHFQIREVTDTPFIDGEGDTAWVISRYRRDDDSQPWEFMSLWTAKRTASNAQRVEDNIRFIRLGFPVNSRTKWNGNAFNFFDPEEYTYDDIHDPLNMSGFSFDSTVTVIQNDFESHINRIMKKEIYANHVGMIFKQLDSVRHVNLPNGSRVILNGVEYSQMVTGYGN